MTDTEQERTNDAAATPGFFQVLRSVLASGLGVQSRSNMERDMKASSPLPFIVVGLVGTALFIAAVVFVVRLVLRSAGV